jgi:GNAT superfamily N-acetyltransferase
MSDAMGGSAVDLVLGVVVLVGEQGCTVRLLQSGERTEAIYADPISRYGVQILPDDLVAVDCSERPPVVAFRWALTRVKQVEGDRILEDRLGTALSLAEGLEVELEPGDSVYAEFGKVYDVCSPVLPAHPERLRAALPEIEAFLDRIAGDTSPAPVSEGTVRAGPTDVRYLTAETEEGRQAIREVMSHSYSAEVDERWPSWAISRVVDGVPVSFILVNPDQRMDFPGGEVRCAFVNDVATREDRRREGHFRALMTHTFARLREAGIPLVLLHGRYPLYRQFGFDVFTHHCGIFCTVEQIDRVLGLGNVEDAPRFLTIEEGRGLQEDLLLVTDVKASTLQACKRALRAAGAVARARGKERILFEQPACDARYSIHASLEMPLTEVARTCGAQVCVQGADPEGGTIPDADWIKVLDAAAFVQRVLDVLDMSGTDIPDGRICLDTDAGAVTIECQEGVVGARARVHPGVEAVHWPSSALAQLVTGYRSVELLSELNETSVSSDALASLGALFPPRWRLSRNESWTYRS